MSNFYLADSCSKSDRSFTVSRFLQGTRSSERARRSVDGGEEESSETDGKFDVNDKDDSQQGINLIFNSRQIMINMIMVDVDDSEDDYEMFIVMMVVFGNGDDDDGDDGDDDDDDDDDDGDDDGGDDDDDNDGDDDDGDDDDGDDDDDDDDDELWLFPVIIISVLNSFWKYADDCFLQLQLFFLDFQNPRSNRIIQIS